MTAPSNDFPDRDNEVLFDSSDDILVIVDGPGDTTVRPRPPNVPRYYPGRTPPPGYPGDPEPPKPPSSGEQPSPPEKS